jgi:hypothetical protein
VTFFDFAQKRLLIDVATALAHGNGPLLLTALSYLSSRAKRADLRCAIRVRRFYRPTTPTNHHRILMETPTFPFVIPGFQEWSAEPQISRLRLSGARTDLSRDTARHGAESKNPEGAYPQLADPSGAFSAKCIVMR